MGQENQRHRPSIERILILLFCLFWNYDIFLETLTDEPKREEIMKEEEIIARIREAAKEGKLPCAMAMKIAAESKISNKELGDLLNRLKIKVAQCQLGCF
jgi:hypothetical protein